MVLLFVRAFDGSRRPVQRVHSAVDTGSPSLPGLDPTSVPQLTVLVPVGSTITQVAPASSLFRRSPLAL